MSRPAAAILITLVLAVGIFFGATLPRSSSSPENAKPEQPTETKADARVLNIRQQTYRETLNNNGDPVGHIVTLTGVVSSSLLVTHEIREQDRQQLPLVSGEVLRRDGFVFAGLTDELLFVRQWGVLQIQRQIEVENETPDMPSDVLPLEVIATYEIGETTTVAFE
ncbi:hypothetical protein M0Q28_00345 [Patescibacteria group bacterium]|jgi:hypothetical protein|nr:hypothetical protein [Patescibacteria group bacterium]